MNNSEQTNSIERVSITTEGIQANGQSGASSVSDDGRFILFESNATNLIPDDFNGQTDSFLYDRISQSVELISLAPDNSQANGSSSSGSISGDGNYVTFASFANNLVTNDINNQGDIFIYNRLNQTTELVSVASDGTQANGLSLFSAVSDNGRYVAFESMADNLVANDNNGLGDIFVRDLIEQTTVRINIANDGTQANGYSSLGSISDDGRYISFASDATNLVLGDTNGQTDIFVHDLRGKTTERINISDSGVQANGNSGFSSISGDGRYVVYESDANNLVLGDTNEQKDIFIYDRIESNTERVSIGDGDIQSNGDSRAAVVSDDGRYVAFQSEANNLVADDTNEQVDIFIRDREGSQTTKKIEVNSFPILSGNAQSVVFNSSLSNLVAGDTNGTGDVFVLDLEVSETEEPVSEEPVTEEPVTEEPVTEEPMTEEPVSEKPVTEEPVTEEPMTEEPMTEEPVTEEPVTEEPRTEEPVTEEPRTEELVTEEPVTEEPRTEEPVTEEPRTEEPVTEEPVTEEPVTEEPVTDEPVTEEPVTEEPVTEEPVTEEPVTEEPVTEEPVTEEPVTEEPVTEEPVTEEPVTEEPVTEEPVTEEPVTEEPDLNRFTTDDVHRFYQYEKGFHLYTTDDNEIEVVQQRSEAGELAYQYEAEKYTVLSDNKDALTGETLEGVKPVYRFFNRETGAHLYTTDENERSVILDTLSNYNFEGVKYYAFDTEPTEIETIPVFRMLNSDSGSHLFTIDQNELNYIQEKLPNFSFENNGNAVFHVFEL